MGKVEVVLLRAMKMVKIINIIITVIRAGMGRQIHHPTVTWVLVQELLSSSRVSSSKQIASVFKEEIMRLLGS